MLSAFQTGLREVGYIENQNVRIIFRYADGQYAKRIGLLHQLVPKVDAVGVLFNPTYTVAGAQLKEMEAAAASLNLRLIIANASPACVSRRSPLHHQNRSALENQPLSALSSFGEVMEYPSARGPSYSGLIPAT